MKLRKVLLTICALLLVSGTGCSLIEFKDEVDSSADTVAAITSEATAEPTMTGPEDIETTVETSIDNSMPSLESDIHLPASVPGTLITEINSHATIDCSLTSHDFVGAITSDQIAVVRMNFNGSRPIDSEITTIENSEIIYRDLDGNLLNTVTIDSIYVPRIRFDYDGNLHAFLSDGDTTEHRVYRPDGTEIRAMRNTMDIYPLEMVFDTNGYMYIQYYDWTADRSMVSMYSPDGELIASRGDNDISLITINQVPYNVRHSDNASFSLLIPTAEFVQNLDYERITVRDVNANNPISGFGGFYYIDSANQTLCAYDLETETSYILVRNANMYYDSTWPVGDSIIAALAFENPIIYR